MTPPKKTTPPPDPTDDQTPPERTVSVICRMPESLHEQLRAAAVAEERSVAATIRMLCARYVADLS